MRIPHLLPLFSLAIALAGARAQADVVTFEDVPLSSGSSLIGPLPAPPAVDVPESDAFGNFWTNRVGTINSGGVAFVNKYNLTYSSPGVFDIWSGFGVTNTTDTTPTPLPTIPPSFNPPNFTAFPGSGAGTPGSANYGIGFGYVDNLDTTSAAQLANLPTLQLPAGAWIERASITNTIYSYYSMLNGDGFGKKFGGDFGTDPDFFLLSVYGTDSLGNVLLDSFGNPVHVDKLLADYTGATDFIVDDWEVLELGALAGASQLHFQMTSSDTGPFGMNTPATFAIDNIEFNAVPEPGTFALGLVCLAMAIGWRVRAKRRAAKAALAA